jgi:hypothetical protein
VAGNRCAFPGCGLALMHGHTMVGEFCHIRAASPNGPRYDANQAPAERHGFENLLLLCAVHHRVVDTEVGDYPVDRLLKMKADHESGANKISADKAEQAAVMMITMAPIAVTANNIGTVNIITTPPADPPPQPAILPDTPHPLPISAGMIFAGFPDILNHMGPMARDIYSFNTRRFAYLRLIPPSGFPVIGGVEVWKTVKDLRLLPMSKRWSGTQARNKHGAMYYVEVPERTITSLTQCFNTGELWGMTSDVIEEQEFLTPENAQPHRLPIIAALPMEQTYVVTLENYANVASKVLGMPFPYDIELGMTGIEHGFLTFPSNGPGFNAGPIYAEGIRRRYQLEEATPTAVRQLLAKYFDDLYSQLVSRRRRDLVIEAFIGPNDLPPLV